MKKLMKYLVGDVEEKRAWRRTMKRVRHCPTIIALFMKKLSRISGALPEEQAWICLKRSMSSLNCLKKAQPKERMF